MTVSPAPVTSNTAWAAVAMWTGRRPASKRLMPCSPRVMRAAAPPVSVKSRAPARRRSASPRMRMPVACSASSWFGVTRVAPR